MSLYYKVEDVMKFMECSKPTAYRIIGELNQELEAKGILTLSGKINKTYFHQRYDVREFIPKPKLKKAAN